MHVTSDTLGLIGNTPLVRLKGPSEATGCDIFGKCEFANPGASIKDRAALFIVQDAEERGAIAPGGTIVEGTAGNTGIGLALVANAKGYKTIIVMPETQSGRIDGFTCAVGTGGTLAGVGLGLKAKDEKVCIALSDPYGAALYDYYACGELKSEGSSVAEGIGQGRITGNLEGAPVDTQFRISDEEGLEWVRRLLDEEGLCLGLSSGINVAGAVRLAKQLGTGKRIATILCDTGFRYLSTLYNPEWLRSKGLPVAEGREAA
jgi:cysteine synthase